MNQVRDRQNWKRDREFSFAIVLKFVKRNTSLSKVIRFHIVVLK